MSMRVLRIKDTAYPSGKIFAQVPEPEPEPEPLP